MAGLFALRSKESPLDPSIRLERASTLEPFGNTGCALMNDRIDRFSLVLTFRNLTLQSVSSQLHNLKVGLHGVCSTTKLCDKSPRTPDDASTTLGELETNLTERCHRLMRAISEA
jgi:hypothetical protein